MDNSEMVCSPSYEDWEQVLTYNLKWNDSFNVIGEAQRELRELFLSQSYAYTKDLMGGQCFEPDRDKPLVLTGHQPRVYHPGILVKNELLNRFATDSAAAGLNVIVDTDTGDGGHFYFPKLTGDNLSLGSGSFAAPGQSTFLSQVVADKNSIQKLRGEVSASLSALNLSYEQELFDEVCNLYQEHSEDSIVKANTLVRKKFIGTDNVLELPLSQVIRALPAINIISHFIERSEEFFEKYNVALGAFRKSHKIKNPANPFPDLKKISEGIELPFWIVDLKSGTRSPLFVERKGKFIELSKSDGPWLKVELENLSEVLFEWSDREFLAPRAMVITILLRMFVGDFFVHGIGGAKYDACTDEFIKAFFEVDPPKFVSASANKYLLAGERKEFLAAKDLYGQKRAMYFRPEKFADSGLFSKDEIEKIAEFSQAKNEMISMLKQKKSEGESVSDITQEIKKLERSVGEIVDRALESKLGNKVNIPADRQSAILCREYPYFFFL